MKVLHVQHANCNFAILKHRLWSHGRSSTLDTEGMQTMCRLADNMSVMLKMYATGKAEQPEVEPWNPMHFIRRADKSSKI